MRIHCAYEGDRRVNDTRIEQQDQSTWAKLRHRKVVQWGLVYVAAAWGFLQGLEYVSESFHWPEQLRQIALLAVLIGLPIVLVLAWYHGDRGQQRISTPEFAILTLLLLLGGGAFWYYQHISETAMVASSPPTTVAPAATDRSIAVLPFVNMSSDKEQEYFADGISEEVLNLLAQVPELRVIASTSSFTFKGKEVGIEEIARTLNVAHVLEGSVRRSGDKARITAQLIRASDSSHLWSNTYDRELKDIFAVQDEIAAAVVRQLKVALLGGELRTRSAVTNLEAYNLHLKARYLFEQHTDQSMTKAVEFYEAALAIDPAYAEAWAGLAEAQAVRADEGSIDFTVGAEKARAAAQRALELSPDMAKAHFALGMVQFGHDWNWPAADASFNRAIELDPNEAKALALAGALAQILGRDADGIRLCRQAVANNPIGGYERTVLGWVLAQADRIADAEKEIRAALELNPDFQGWYFLSLTLLLKGQPKLALEAMQKESSEWYRLAGLPLAYYALGQKDRSEVALKETKSKYAENMSYQIAQVHAYRGEIDEAFLWLERAYVARDTGLAWYLRTDPLLANIRGDPRYTQLLHRMKLPKG
jgi:TolB-like protein/Tfp pilus assembly protein PilF